MVKRKTIIQLSKEVRQKRELVRETLKQQSLSAVSEEKITFPAFAFKDDATYIRVFPWKYNGFILHLGSLIMVIDPGVDFLSRCIFSNINIMQPNTIFISHGHLDHYASASIMLEIMKSEEKDKQIKFIASKEFYQQRVISEWHLNKKGDGLKNIKTITAIPNEKIVFDAQTQLIPIPLIHTKKGTIGFIIFYKKIKIGYITDTGYTKQFKTNTGNIYRSGEEYEGEFEKIISKHEYIKEIYKNVDYLICNINDFIYTKHSKTHLSGYDIIDILKGSTAKECIITHLNQFDLTNNTYSGKVAEEIQQNTGVRTTTVQKNGYTLKIS